MTLPSTGPITMQQVANELGVSVVGLSLNAANVRALAGVASGPIGFSDLRGKSAVGYPTISGVGAGTTTVGANSTGRLRVFRDGTWIADGQPTVDDTTSGDWLNPKAADSGDTRWVRVDIVSGSLTSGSTGVWEQLSTTRTWTRTSTSDVSTVIRVRIATDAAGSTVVSDGNVTLQCVHDL